MPSKALLNIAKAYKPKVNFKQIMEQVDEVVQDIYAHETPDIFEKMGIDVFVN